MFENTKINKAFIWPIWHSLLFAPGPLDLFFLHLQSVLAKCPLPDEKLIDAGLLPETDIFNEL